MQVQYLSHLPSTMSGRVGLRALAVRAFASAAKRVVIVGGVAGGASAAARARRWSEPAEITVFERGPHVSFANCGLPYHVGGTIKSRDALQVHTPQSLSALLNLRVRTHCEVAAINRHARTVTVKDLSSGTVQVVPYDALVLSPGASPIRPPLPGFNHPRVLTLRTLADMDAIMVAMRSTESCGAGVDGAKECDVVVVGAGFIGLEMAEQLTKAGKKVTVVEREAHVLPQVDGDIAAALQSEMTTHGVTVLCGQSVQAIQHSDDFSTVQLASGSSVRTRLVLLSVGVRPDSAVAKAAGLALTPTGHIIVNQFQQTSDPHIYAVGDAVETADAVVDGARAKVALGGPANRQGRVAADHIFEPTQAKPYPGSIGTAIVRAFGLTVGVTGWSTAALQRAKLAFHTSIVVGDDHASYYPDATSVTLKLLWSPTDGRVLGAQAYGKKGVDKRIDVLATALRARMTIDDLTHLELAYAPPFNSAKDVINLIGFIASNQRAGFANMATDLNAFVKTAAGPVTVLDVRPATLTSTAPLAPINGANVKVIPNGAELRARLSELDPAGHVITVCNRGKQSYFASRILAQSGIKATSLLGGVSHHPELVRKPE